MTAATALLLNETRDDLNELEGDFNTTYMRGRELGLGREGGRCTSY